MTRLSTEARPISLARLTREERELVKRISDLVLAMGEDADRAQAGDSDDRIGRAIDLDEHRSGRAILIDGHRGAGKTSFLLTLMREWFARRPDSRRLMKGAPMDVAHEPDLEPHLNSAARIIRLVTPRPLDFDPLPHGLSIHGWLIQAWGRTVERLAASDSNLDPDDQSLRDVWQSLFDAAVTGWSPVRQDSRSLIDRTLDAHDQAQSLFEIAHRFHDFIARLRRVDGGTSVFVVAIDDVDLQVRRLPELLHALRLLHHPAVAYLLTGDRKHLGHVVHMDFLRQHLHVCHGDAIGGGLRDDVLYEQIRSDAERLANAFVEKAIPKANAFRLMHCRLRDLAAVTTRGAANAVISLGEVLDGLKRSEPTADKRTITQVLEAEHDLGMVPFAPFRSVQQALDADDEKDLMPARADRLLFRITNGVRGTLITDRSPPFTPWHLSALPSAGGGTQIEIRVASAIPPHRLHRAHGVAVRSDGDEVAQGTDDQAARREAASGLLVAIALELGYETPQQVVWQPDWGFVWTNVVPNGLILNPKLDRGVPMMVFHWPWLLRPRASAWYMSWSRWSNRRRQWERSPQASNQRAERERALLALWIEHNIETAAYELLAHGKLEAKALADQADGHVSWDGAGGWTEVVKAWAGVLGALPSEEVTRWRAQLAGMQLEFWGLDAQVRGQIAKLFASEDIALVEAETRRSVEAALRTSRAKRESKFDEIVNAILASFPIQSKSG